LVPDEDQGTFITALIMDPASTIKTTEAAVETSASAVTRNLNALKTCLDKQDVIQKHNIMKMRFDIADVYKDNKDYNNVLNLSYQSLENYYRYVSVLAEYKRQLKSLEEDKNNIAAEAAYKTTTTGAQVIINGERISVTSQDADGNKRTNKEAGIYLNANNIDLNSYQDPKDKSMTMMPYSCVSIASKNINIQTSDITEYEAKDTTVKGLYNPAGNVNINSLNITVESTKKEIERTYAVENNDTKVTVKETVKDYPDAAPKDDNNDKGRKDGDKKLDENGSILVKSKFIMMESTDKDNKADGVICLNAKQTELTAVDKKFMDGEVEATTKGSILRLYSEQILNGFMKRFDDKESSQGIYFYADNVSGFSHKYVSFGQGKDDTSITGVAFENDEGKIRCVKPLLIDAQLEVKQNATFMSNVNVKGLMCSDSLEAKSSFLSPNQKESVVKEKPEEKTNEMKIEMKEK